MYCRTCGNEMNDNAELCVKCGVKKNVGSEYCQACGARTTSDMVNCNKCGAKLMKAVTLTQVKKKAATDGKKIIGTVLFVIGIIFLIGLVLNVFAIFVNHDGEAFGNAIICLIIGAVFAGIGSKLRKK